MRGRPFSHWHLSDHLDGTYLSHWQSKGTTFVSVTGSHFVLLGLCPSHWQSHKEGSVRAGASTCPSHVGGGTGRHWQPVKQSGFRLAWRVTERRHWHVSESQRGGSKREFQTPKPKTHKPINPKPEIRNLQPETPQALECHVECGESM